MSFIAVALPIGICAGLAAIIAGLVWLDRPQPPPRDNSKFTRRPR